MRPDPVLCWGGDGDQGSDPHNAGIADLYYRAYDIGVSFVLSVLEWGGICCG